MLEPDPNLLGSRSESLKESGIIEGTYGTGGAWGGGVSGEGSEGGDVEGEDVGGVEGVKRTVVVFRFGVRYPGIRGSG